MIHRVYVEKREGFDADAAAAAADIRSFLGIGELRNLRLLNRYDVEGIGEEQFLRCKTTVFSEPVTDAVYASPPSSDHVIAVEYLPGQYDQRADSAAQCIQLVVGGERPAVRNARIYLLYGKLSESDISRIEGYLINPVESRRASLMLPDTLALEAETPPDIPVVDGLRGAEGPVLDAFIKNFGLAMDAADLGCVERYFSDAGRDPTLAELRVLDTYWSDHCRHSTFGTVITETVFRHPAAEAAFRRYLAVKAELGRGDKPLTLMDVATIGARYLKAAGRLPLLDESDEINACTVKTKIEVDGESEDWLLLFKNETHNHPTEIEPFGGAATCIGGAIRDPLSGRAYVYQAMRLTGAGDITAGADSALPGKLPQRRISTLAANGYSSYGNQIGLATGHVDEIYHPGYTAKRMEVGAVVGAAPAKNVVRKKPLPGDAVILLGGRTGRDGVGGATGSSKILDSSSLASCGAEVQKGNAPEERKLQRLFRDPGVTALIKRCNDFGAGGVAVAVGELADGLDIDLDAVPKKYDGLDGVELAVSESQERMAVVVSEGDAGTFIRLAARENLEASVVARVTEEPKLVMRWRGKKIVELDRAFLDTNGAVRYAAATVEAPEHTENITRGFADGLSAMAGNLNSANKRGLVERFDSTVGARTVLMPYGGRYQLTPESVMAAKFPLTEGETDSVSVMSWGFDPFVSERDPYRGGYLAVVESLAKLAAAGALTDETYLSFQEFFPRLRDDPSRWGKPLAALLGAFDAQLDFSVAAIGGKDSMSGSFEKMDVPSTLISFAVSVACAGDIVSSAFKSAGSAVRLLLPEQNAESGLPDARSQRRIFETLRELGQSGRLLAARAVGSGGVAEAVFKMTLGNRLGFAFADELSPQLLFGAAAGAVVVEVSSGCDAGTALGEVLREDRLTFCGETVELAELRKVNDAVLSGVFPTETAARPAAVPAFSADAADRIFPREHVSKPLAAIPVFPGTNCEYDTAAAVTDAGGSAEIFVINNLTPAGVEQSAAAFARLIGRSQIIVIPGGFSGGDEPDGSGKFIAAFFRNPAIRDGVHALLRDRDGLMLGICNGFQALIKLGLLPFGEITDAEETSPTLAVNLLRRHQSRMVDVRVSSNRSPWLSEYSVGDIETLPISHGEGRFVADGGLLRRLDRSGQIATQYVDLHGSSTLDPAFNPSGSTMAVEGLLSPDGRIFGRMGHFERMRDGLYKNVDVKRCGSVFGGAVNYFR